MFIIDIMSGSNALAAAKRRRVDGVSKPSPPVARPNNSQQRPQTQPQYQNSASAISSRNQVVNAQYKDNNTNGSTQRNKITFQPNVDNADFNMQDRNNMFVIPQPPQGVNPLELLTVHHVYINKMATHLPNALDVLGENFNTMSANCDNLNERLETIERHVNLSSENGTIASLSNPVSQSLNVDTIKKIEEQNNTISSLTKTIEELKSSLFNLQSHTIENDNAFKKLKENVFDQNNKFMLEIEGLKDTILQMQESTYIQQDVSDVVVEDAEGLVQETLSNADEVSLEVCEN